MYKAQLSKRLVDNAVAEATNKGMDSICDEVSAKIKMRKDIAAFKQRMIQAKINKGA